VQDVDIKLDVEQDEAIRRKQRKLRDYVFALGIMILLGLLLVAIFDTMPTPTDGKSLERERCEEIGASE